GGLREGQSGQKYERGCGSGEQGELGHRLGLLDDGEQGIPAPFSGILIKT
ncbi:MAG: hypothetical protein ACI82N_001597, partial [Maricaulis sp.]